MLSPSEPNPLRACGFKLCKLYGEDFWTGALVDAEDRVKKERHGR